MKAEVWWMVLLSAGLFLQLSVVNGTNCQDQLTCHDCLQTANCSWCSRPANYSNAINEKNRCFQSSSYTEKNCKDYIVDYKNKGEIKEGKMLTKKISPNEEIVQIWPQKVSVKLRVNTPYKLTVNYTQAEDNPLDLYYLMDISFSMADDFKTLKKVGNDLAKQMIGITSNFQMGFGRFVDKNVLPFFKPKPRQRGGSAHGFDNEVKLTNYTSLFTNTLEKMYVEDEPFLYNDDTEGGLDAMMQVVVCQEAIGWRNNARRLLLYSSDDQFHMAGDGKLAGLIIPNDGLCHLDENGEYDYFDKQDYPSISQINQKVKDNSINVIFAVTNKHLSLYKELSKEVEGSKAAEISDDSSNILRLVKEEYDKIRTSVEMKAEPSEPVKVTFYSRCEGGRENQTAKCEKLALGSVVTFTAELELTACPADRKQWHQTLKIKPVGVSQEVTVEVEMLCDCPCEHEDDPAYESVSSECSSAGSYQCGLCKCNEGRVGSFCECGSDSPVGINSTNSCRKAKDLEVCSGRGDCRCGRCGNCKMEQGFQTYGKYCECDDFSCERHNNLVCSGPGKGECKCGDCHCLPGWEGSACACSQATNFCKPLGGGELCSGRGTCECNKCMCNIISGSEKQRYLGNVCQICPTCPDQCDKLKHCVFCLSYQTGKDRENCKSNCTLSNTVLQDQEAVKAEEGESFCRSEVNDCYFNFVYSYSMDGEQGKIHLKTRTEKRMECREPVNLFLVGLLVAALILLIGLASLIIWKMVTTVHDRREFVKFQKEILHAKWINEENPLYVTAVNEFSNPTYSGKEPCNG